MLNFAIPQLLQGSWSGSYIGRMEAIIGTECLSRDRIIG